MTGHDGGGDPAVLRRVLRRTGLAFPRGVLGPETARLADAVAGPGQGVGDVVGLLDAAAAALWPTLRASTEAALRRHAARAGLGDVEDIRTALAWAADPDPANPLSRALALRAAEELGAAVARARSALAAAEPAVGRGGPEGAVAAATAAGTMVVELLDLDPEDVAPEIVAYVEGGEGPDALDELARATGDDETRDWARSAVAALRAPDAPLATAAVRELAQGPPPEDPAQDAVWVPAVLALVELAVERAAAESAGGH